MSTTKRVYPPTKAEKKAEDYHGGARYERIVPDLTAGDGKRPIDSLNIHMTFEEALKLSLALQSCLLQLNKFKRQGEGKKMGVALTLHTGNTSIKVIEKSISVKQPK